MHRFKEAALLTAAVFLVAASVSVTPAVRLSTTLGDQTFSTSHALAEDIELKHNTVDCGKDTFVLREACTSSNMCTKPELCGIKRKSDKEGKFRCHKHKGHYCVANKEEPPFSLLSLKNRSARIEGAAITQRGKGVKLCKSGTATVAYIKNKELGGIRCDGTEDCDRRPGQEESDDEAGCKLKRCQSKKQGELIEYKENSKDQSRCAHKVEGTTKEPIILYTCNNAPPFYAALETDVCNVHASTCKSGIHPKCEKRGAQNKKYEPHPNEKCFQAQKAIQKIRQRATITAAAAVAATAAPTNIKAAVVAVTAVVAWTSVIKPLKQEIQKCKPKSTKTHYHPAAVAAIIAAATIAIRSFFIVQ